MIYLLLSILCGSMVSLVMRISEGRIGSKTGMVAMNYLTCLLVAGSFMGFGNVMPEHPLAGRTLGMGVINGIFYMAGLLMMQYNIPRNGVVLPSVFSRMGGLLVPLAVAILFFHEAPTVMQILGSVLAIAAILILNYQKDAGNVGDKKALVMLFIADGLAGIMAKVFSEIGDQVLSPNFLFFTFSSAFVFCSMIVLMKKERPGLREVGFGMMVGVPNFMGARFTLKALETIPAVIVYPMRSVSTIVIITLAGTLFFREKLSRRQLAAMGIILASLILLNV